MGSHPTGAQLSLILSLLFGAGQIVVGVALIVYGLRRRRWRSPTASLVLLLGTWCVCSGATEVFVSGMETLHATTGSPSGALFAVWRGRADSTLLVACLFALGIWLLAALSSALATRLRGARPRQTSHEA